MRQGWLIYNRVDLEKNKVFAKMLIDYGKSSELELELFERETLILGVDEEGLYIQTPKGSVLPSFVINRTRDSFFAKQLELMGVKVFNSYEVTDLCNDKRKTHQYINQLGIPSVRTVFYDKYYGASGIEGLGFPLVIKSVDGHGGTEVYRIDNKVLLKDFLQKNTSRYLVVQAMCSQSGIDIRVFCVGGRIVGAIKRESQVDFRSNYSLGGNTSWYEVDDQLRERVELILKALPCDCVGIDFMVDDKGTYLFNEIEDVVGSRSLYQHSEVDIAKLYIQHIQTKIG